MHDTASRQYARLSDEAAKGTDPQLKAGAANAIIRELPGLVNDQNPRHIHDTIRRMTNSPYSDGLVKKRIFSYALLGTP